MGVREDIHREEHTRQRRFLQGAGLVRVRADGSAELIGRRLVPFQPLQLLSFVSR